MYLAYFDENKFDDKNPFFVIGGLLLESTKAVEIEGILQQIQFNFFGSGILRKDNEFHGKDMLHGKTNCKRRTLSDRIRLFEDLASVVINHKIPVRLVSIDVKKHQKRYAYPMPEYRLGLMLILERFCDYLDSVDDLGIVFGDFEKDEMTNSIVDFSEFKFTGSTPMYHGRPLGRLLDTVYFTQSHHSRYLQLADVLVYLAGRYEHGQPDLTKWHEEKLNLTWQKIKTNTDFKIQYWPKP